jgi:hypothetical protein
MINLTQPWGLTVDMTAEPADCRGRGRTLAEAIGSLKRLGGLWWMTTDDLQRTVNP